jgi:hypothetical protein
VLTPTGIAALLLELTGPGRAHAREAR